MSRCCHGDNKTTRRLRWSLPPAINLTEWGRGRGTAHGTNERETEREKDMKM